MKMLCPYTHCTIAFKQMIELIYYTNTATKGSSQSRSCQSKSGNGAKAANQNGAKNNVTDIGQPQAFHSHRRIASATEDTIDHKQQHDHQAAAHHNACIVSAGFYCTRLSTH